MNAVPAAESESVAAVTPQMQKVLDYIKENGQITEKGISDLLGLKKDPYLHCCKTDAGSRTDKSCRQRRKQNVLAEIICP